MTTPSSYWSYLPQDVDLETWPAPEPFPDIEQPEKTAVPFSTNDRQTDSVRAGWGGAGQLLSAPSSILRDKRPFKCPVPTCNFNKKGFESRYRMVLHAFRHLGHCVVCGFCPSDVPADQRIFNALEYLKGHLVSAHRVKSRDKCLSADESSELDGTKCSMCSRVFKTAQKFYRHLNDCVLHTVAHTPDPKSMGKKAKSSNQAHTMGHRSRVQLLPADNWYQVKDPPEQHEVQARVAQRRYRKDDWITAAIFLLADCALDKRLSRLASEGHKKEAAAEQALCAPALRLQEEKGMLASPQPRIHLQEYDETYTTITDPVSLLPRPASLGFLRDSMFECEQEELYEKRSDGATDEAIDDDELLAHLDYGSAVTVSPAKSRCSNFDELSFRNGSFLAPFKGSFVELEQRERQSVGPDLDSAVCVDDEGSWIDAAMKENWEFDEEREGGHTAL